MCILRSKGKEAERKKEKGRRGRPFYFLKDGKNLSYYGKASGTTARWEGGRGSIDPISRRGKGGGDKFSTMHFSQKDERLGPRRMGRKGRGREEDPHYLIYVGRRERGKLPHLIRYLVKRSCSGE